MVNVQVTDKDKFKKVGATASLQVDPMTITNFEMKEDGTMKESTYTGTDAISICFDGLA